MPHVPAFFGTKQKMDLVKLQVLGRFLSYMQALPSTYLFLKPQNTKYYTNTRGLICSSPPHRTYAQREIQEMVGNQELDYLNK